MRTTRDILLPATLSAILCGSAFAQCPGAGNCFVAHANPGCDYTACCQTVCAADPFCCNTQWDTTCANQAGMWCVAAPIVGPITNPTNGNEYYILSDSGWQIAEDAAVDLGGHLATISSAEENEWIRATIANHGGVARFLWIGLNDKATPNIFVWTSGAATTYLNWAPGEPNNSGGNEDAVDMNPVTGKWNDYPSTQTTSFGVVEIPVFFCGDAEAGSCFNIHNNTHCDNADCCSYVCSVDPFCCTTKWDAQCVTEANQFCVGCAPGNHSCFVTGGKGCNDDVCCNAICEIDPFCCATTWDSVCVTKANEWCKADQIAGPIENIITGDTFYLLDESFWTIARRTAQDTYNGNLATITSMTENTFIRDKVVKFDGVNRAAWIGLWSPTASATFVWTTGTPVTFTNWASLEPNNIGLENYVELIGNDGKWNNNDNFGTGNGETFAVVQAFGTGCGEPGTENCFSAHNEPHCSIADCCAAVCAQDPFCCTNKWDAICANQASTLCDGCGDPAAGSCTSIHGPYCSSAACCDFICGNDPFCCATSWDQACVNQALAGCGGFCPGDLNIDGNVDGADLGILLGGWATSGISDINDDGTTNGQDLGLLLGAWGNCQ